MRIFIAFAAFLALGQLRAESSFPLEILNSSVRQLSPGHWELTEFRKKLPPTLIVPKDTVLHRCRIGSRSCKGPQIIIPNLNASLREELEIEISKDSGKEVHHLSLLPESAPLLRISGKSALPFPLIFSAHSFQKGLYKGCNLYILAPDGSLSMFLQLPEDCSDFRPHSLNGKTFYSLQKTIRQTPGFPPFGTRILLDENLNILKELSPIFAEPEFLLFGEDHWIGIEWETARTKRGMPYINRTIRERRNGKIIFEWSVSDYIKAHGSEAMLWAGLRDEEGITTAELLKINSLQRVNENLLVGLGSSGVTLLSPEGKILWTLGGLYDEFSLDRDQHNLFAGSVTLDPKKGEVLLVANRRTGVFGTLNSSFRKYKLDIKNKKLLELKEIRSIGNEYLSSFGSIQEIQSVYNLGFGTRESGQYDFIEINKGKETLKVQLSPGFFTYHVYRRPQGDLP